MKKQKVKTTKTAYPWNYLPLLVILVGFTLLISLIPTYLPNNQKQRESVRVPVNKEVLAASTSATFRIPILLYHYVEQVKDKRDTIRSSLNTPPEIFENQIQTLKNSGYTFLHIADVADILDGKRSAPQKPVVLTFDDGYEDLYTYVFPILKKHDAKVTTFLVPGFFDSANYLKTSQVKELAQNSLFEIAAHTIHHINLKGKPKLEVETEIVQSKNVLEQLLDIPIVSFAYPYGGLDEQAVRIVKETGFKTAASTMLGTQVNDKNRFSLFRIRPGNRTGTDLLGYLEQIQ